MSEKLQQIQGEGRPVAFASSAFAETVIIKHGHPHPHFRLHPHKVVIIQHH